MNQNKTSDGTLNSQIAAEIWVHLHTFCKILNVDWKERKQINLLPASPGALILSPVVLSTVSEYAAVIS